MAAHHVSILRVSRYKPKLKKESRLPGHVLLEKGDPHDPIPVVDTMVDTKPLQGKHRETTYFW